MSRSLVKPDLPHRLQLVAPKTLNSENLQITSNEAGKDTIKTCTDRFSNMKRRLVQSFLHHLHLGCGQTSLYSQITAPESPFLELPREVHNRIIFFLPLCSRLSLRLTCRDLYHSQTTWVSRLFEMLITSPYSRFHILVWLERDGLWRQPGSLAVCSRCYGVYKLKKSFPHDQKKLPNEDRVCHGCVGAIYLDPQHTMSFRDYKDIVRYYKVPGNFSLNPPGQVFALLRMLPEDHPKAPLFHTWTTSTVHPTSFTPPGLDSGTYMGVEHRSPRPIASPYNGVNLVGLLHWRHLFFRSRRAKLAIVTFYVIGLAQHGSCRFPLCPHHMSNETALCQIVRSNQPGDIHCRQCRTMIMMNVHAQYPFPYVTLFTVRYPGAGLAPDKAWLKNLE